MQGKRADPDFISDTEPILLPSISFNPAEAYRVLHEPLLSRIDYFRDNHLRKQ